MTDVESAALDEAAERGFKNQSEAPKAYYFTVVLDDGKRSQLKAEEPVETLRDRAQKVGTDGYSFEENGVWTHYPARRIAKVTIQVAE